MPNSILMTFAGMEVRRDYMGLFTKRSPLSWSQIEVAVLVEAYRKKISGLKSQSNAPEIDNIPDRYLLLYDKAHGQLLKIPGGEKLEAMADAIAALTGRQLKSETKYR
jgi:hypothetical protein